MTTGLSASLAVHGEVKRGSCYMEPKAPLIGGGEAPTETLPCQHRRRMRCVDGKRGQHGPSDISEPPH